MYYGSIHSNQTATPALKNHHLLQPLAPPRKRVSHSSLKLFLSIALLMACVSVICVIPTLDDHHWLLRAWELGWSGHVAQKVADTSLIRSSQDELLEMKKQLSSYHHKKKKKKPTVSTEVSDRVPDGCESTVMLIRHCEKGGVRSHCNFIGYERAAYLASIFGDEESAKWPAPFKIYALCTRRKHGKVNYREVETVQRIADKINNHRNGTLVINQKYSTHNHKDLATEILHDVMSGKMCGKLTLVSWKHSDLPKVASLLGCGPLDGCPMDYRGREFDIVYQIKYIYKAYHNAADGKLQKAHWDVYGTTQREFFDPLAFSKAAGDYPARTEKNHTDPDEMLHWKTASTKFYDDVFLEGNNKKRKKSHK